MRTIPHQQISAVATLPAATLVVTWKDGSSDRVDLTAAIAANETLRALTDPAAFAAAAVGEWGWSVSWGSDVELGSEQLWRWAGEQAGELMPCRDFRSWRLRHGLSLAGAAEALGLSRRMVAYYESGERPIPKTVLLATLGYDAMKARAA